MDDYLRMFEEEERIRKENEKRMASTLNEEFIAEYRALLNRVENADKSVNENTMQDFLEQHTAFIPTPFMQNHQLHFNSFISKFPVGPWFTDLAYLTKSTVEWWVVLMELENPHKKVFKGSIDHADFTKDYTQSRQQIRDWKSYIDDHKSEVVDSLKRFRKPLQENKVSFKYVMVMGRRSEIQNSEARRRAIAEENGDNLKIITYDTILSDYERSRRLPAESLVLSMYQGDRFKCKYLPHDMEHSGYGLISASGLFSYMNSGDIQFSDEQIEKLNDDEYEMDSWLKGELLVINEKHTERGHTKYLPEGSFMREFYERCYLGKKD